MSKALQPGGQAEFPKDLTIRGLGITKSIHEKTPEKSGGFPIFDLYLFRTRSEFNES